MSCPAVELKVVSIERLHNCGSHRDLTKMCMQSDVSPAVYWSQQIEGLVVLSRVNSFLEWWP